MFLSIVALICSGSWLDGKFNLSMQFLVYRAPHNKSDFYHESNLLGFLFEYVKLWSKHKIVS